MLRLLTVLVSLLKFQLVLLLNVLGEEGRLSDPQPVRHQGAPAAPGGLDLAVRQRRMAQDLLLGPGAAVDSQLFQVPGRIHLFFDKKKGMVLFAKVV